MCATDGLKLKLEASPDCTLQSSFHNGWKHDRYVTNVYMFVPNGTIVGMAINRPGVLHDSDISRVGNLYGKLEKLYNEHIFSWSCGVVDSAFACKNADYPIQSAQYLPACEITTKHMI